MPSRDGRSFRGVRPGRRVSRLRGGAVALGAALLFPASPLAAEDANAPPEGLPVVQAPDPLPIPVITGSPARGKQLFQGICFACHGVDAAGNAEIGSASLRAQDAWYIVAQLRKFRAGMRGTHPDDLHGAQMRPMSFTLPDEQALSDVALYVASLDGPPPPVTLTGDVKTGQQVYANVCGVCHGADAKGLPQFRSPALVAQRDWYVDKQTRHFRTGLRAYDPQDEAGAQMKAIMTAIPDDASIRNVTAYLATLR